MAPEPSSIDTSDLEDVLGRLQNGPLHRFADFETVADLPREGAAVYTIWDDEGALIYVGVSGRSATSTTGPWGRLRSHWNGRRSGDQFCVYVADHYVLPDLSTEQIQAIAAKEPSLLMDDLIAAVIRDRFSFRIAVVPDYATAIKVEITIKSGQLSAGPPRLNPQRAAPIRDCPCMCAGAISLGHEDPVAARRT
jgi:hypothetical protein